MPEFKFLYKALLKDNTLIELTQDDVSATTPGKNCYYDVLQAEKAGNLRAFAIYSQDTGDEFLVDLQDLHFEVNGVSFFLHGDERLTNIRLVWFLNREISANYSDLSFKGDRFTGYNVGFQGSAPDGSNKQYVIKVT
jgi:hypothetical protein